MPIFFIKGIYNSLKITDEDHYKRLQRALKSPLFVRPPSLAAVACNQTEHESWEFGGNGLPDTVSKYSMLDCLTISIWYIRKYDAEKFITMRK